MHDDDNKAENLLEITVILLRENPSTNFLRCTMPSITNTHTQSYTAGRKMLHFKAHTVYLMFIFMPMPMPSRERSHHMFSIYMFGNFFDCCCTNTKIQMSLYGAEGTHTKSRHRTFQLNIRLCLFRFGLCPKVFYNWFLLNNQEKKEKFTRST